MLILGIETSCDETAASIISATKKEIRVLSNIVSSQVKLHSPWGGVIPNLAAREHLKNIFPVIQETLKKAKKTSQEIDLIAITEGPGLIPALLIGTSVAKTLAFVWNKPVIGIHHIEGHIYANFIGKKKKIKFPLLGLVVSGGHTQLILMKKHLKYEIIGETQDDAAGEAFDKVARILGLGYPGGPLIEKEAQKIISSRSKKRRFNIRLPRPMLKSPDFNFSFSGLKTAVLYETKKNASRLKNPAYISEMAWAFQAATVEILTEKILGAARKFKPKTLFLAGGVSANQELRNTLRRKVQTSFQRKIICQIPALNYSLDNSAMIATAAFFRFRQAQKKKFNWKKIKTEANLKLTTA